jgi:hypothetical protein
MAKINLNNLILSIIFILIPFLEFIKSNFFIIDKTILFTLFYIFSFFIIFFFFVDLILNKIHYFYNQFYFFLFSFYFFLSFAFLDIKNPISNITKISFQISSIIFILLYIFLFSIISKKKIKIFFIFFAYSLLTYYFYFFFKTSYYKLHNIETTQKKIIFLNNEINLKPKNQENIYYFILDGMTSLKYFQESFPETEEKLNNINYLKSNNFIIHENSNSNYNTTYLSLASLIMLDYSVTDKSKKYYDRKEFWPYLLGNPKKKPELISILEEYNMGFNWYGNITASCKNYSYNKDFCPSKSTSNFFYVFNSFFKKTPLITILRKLFPDIMLAGYGDNIDAIKNFLSDFDGLDISKKKFYLIHHLSPHPPYIYNSDCSIKQNKFTDILEESFDGYKDAYLCTLQKINHVIAIILKKDPKSLIVFTADHGWILKNDKKYNNEQLLKFPIFNSFKIDEECKKLVPEKIDAISTVRLVLGCNINKEPILTSNESYIGYQENNVNFGTILKAF